MGVQQPLVEFGVAARTLPGQVECGDRHLARTLPKGVLMAVIDGLGHGPEAAHAAAKAVAVLEADDAASLLTTMQRCHERLRPTRGAVMSLAFFDAREHSLTWLGVGNVEGALLHRNSGMVPAREFLVLRGGLLGTQMPRLQASILPVADGDLLLLATDGIREGFAEDLDFSAPAQAIADRILERYWRGGDDGLVLVARFGTGER